MNKQPETKQKSIISTGAAIALGLSAIVITALIIGAIIFMRGAKLIETIENIDVNVSDDIDNGTISIDINSDQSEESKNQESIVVPFSTDGEKQELYSGSDVKTVSWDLRERAPQPNDNAYQEFAKDIFIDVSFSDGSSEEYPLGTAAGCGESVPAPHLGPNKKVLGHLSCYGMLTGVSYTAYLEDDKFYVESFWDDASGLTAGDHYVILEL